MQIMSVDVETNGLFGPAFAVGAVVMDVETLEIVERFSGRTRLTAPPVDFVREHVLPAVGTIDVYPHQTYLTKSFWHWYKDCKTDEHDTPRPLFVDIGYPVETGFFRFLQECFLDEWGGPYPMHEIATLLLAAGIDPDIDRFEYAMDLMPEGTVFAKHNPLDDAQISAYAAVKALRALGIAKVSA